MYRSITSYSTFVFGEYETMAMNEGFNFAELCRLCSLKSNQPLQIFDKEAEQRQLLFKIRSCVPAVVCNSQGFYCSSAKKMYISRPFVYFFINDFFHN